MAEKTKVLIKSMKKIGNGIWEMLIENEKMASEAKAGQFVSLYLNDRSRLLPRPISICQINREEHTLRLVFRIAGEGTRQISEMRAGECIECMGVLGNGFDTSVSEKALLVGGGIGIPPMLGLAEQLHSEGKKVAVVLGYRNGETFLADEFGQFADVYIATEDGSIGTKGFVTDAIAENKIEADMIYACGPTPMLKSLKAYSEKQEIRAQLSLEEHMACGIGACLACVCKSKDTDHHTNVKNKRICKDGPVFYAEEIEF